MSITVVIQCKITQNPSQCNAYAFFLDKIFMHCQNLSELWFIFVNINQLNAIT